MAGTKIGLDTGAMADIAKMIKKEGAALDAARENIGKLVERANAEWSGAASEAYLEQWQGLDPSFRKGVDVSQSLGDQLEQAAADYDEMDKAHQRTLRGL